MTSRSPDTTITHEVLATKIDVVIDQLKKLNGQVARNSEFRVKAESDVRHIMSDIGSNENAFKGLAQEVSKNSDFRKQAKTVIGVMGVVITSVTGFVAWLSTRLWR